jgi:nucleoside-diphosphate-sugar epimerase
MKVLITGAFEHIGGCLYEYLSKHSDHEAFALVKEEERQHAMEYIKEDRIIAGHAGKLRKLMNEADAVIDAGGCGSQPNDPNIISQMLENTKNLIDMAKSSGVGRYILLSAMGADDPQGANEAYLYKKREAEDYLKNSGLAYTIIRPGHVVYGEPSGKVQMKEKMEWIKDPDISCGDIAKVLAAALDSGRLKNKTLELTSGEKNVDEAIKDV